jgi:hypothetical protein
MGLEGEAAQITAQAIVLGLAPVERRDGATLRRLAQVERAHLLASLLDMPIDDAPIAFRQASEQHEQQFIIAQRRTTAQSLTH